MLWIGLTGGIATGKSTASKILRDELGIPVIDADEIVHKLMKPGTIAFKEIQQYFGQDVLSQDGTIDRLKLGRLVFSDVQLRKVLESIIHPKVQERVQNFKQEQIRKGCQVAIYDVPLLFENQLVGQFDGVLLIACGESVQLDRLMRRNHLNHEDAALRVRSQIPIAEKRSLSTWVIENDSDIESLRMKINQWYSRFISSTN